MRFSGWLRGTLVILIVVGISFRFVNLNHKVYGHKEVNATLQVAGYVSEEVERSLFQDRVVQAQDLQKYQQIKPGSTFHETVHALAIDSPLQPPLYFLIVRSWMQTVEASLTHLFKSPLTTLRSLPALISLLALPAMYGLARELFNAHTIALVATTLVAISPFDVLLAQTAEPQSLLTVIVIASSALLLKAIRLSIKAPSEFPPIAKLPTCWLNWSLYTLSLVIGLYTHTIFCLTLLSHASYVLASSVKPANTKTSDKRILILFGVSLVIAIVAFSPWIGVIATNLQVSKTLFGESSTLPGLGNLLKQSILSVTTPLFDLDVGFFNPLTFLLRVPFLLLIGASIYWIYYHASRSISKFIIFLISIPFLLLIALSPIGNGHRSTINLYFISCIPGVQLAVSYLLTSLLQKNIHKRSKVIPSTDEIQPSRLQSFYHPENHWAPGLFSVVVIACLASLTISAASFTWWDKDSSYFNNRTAEIVNVMPNSIVVSDIGNSYINTNDLLSLSYRLEGNKELLLIETPDFVRTERFRTLIRGKNTIVFRPSIRLQQNLEQTYEKMSPMLAGERLWKLFSSRITN